MPDPALRRHRWPSGPSRPASPPDPGAEALGTIRPPGPAGTPFVCGQARGAKACCRPGWAPEPSSGQPRPRDANARPHALPRREEEPHAAGGEHAPVRENQQLHRGPGPGGRDAAGAHHPRVTVSALPTGGRAGAAAAPHSSPDPAAWGRRPRCPHAGRGRSGARGASRRVWEHDPLVLTYGNPD